MAENTMDFFAAQDAARRKTSLLVVYYVLAVVLIIASIYGVVATVFAGAEAKMATSGQNAGSSLSPESLWNPELFTIVAARRC